MHASVLSINDNSFFFFFNEILFSWKCTFTIGTGKTNTAIKLIYLFDNINKELERKGGDKKHIVFCGPSNKSVDVVAGKK